MREGGMKGHWGMGERWQSIGKSQRHDGRGHDGRLC